MRLTLEQALAKVLGGIKEHSGRYILYRNGLYLDLGSSNDTLLTAVLNAILKLSDHGEDECPFSVFPSDSDRDAIYQEIELALHNQEEAMGPAMNSVMPNGDPRPGLLMIADISRKCARMITDFNLDGLRNELLVLNTITIAMLQSVIEHCELRKLQIAVKKTLDEQNN